MALSQILKQECSSCGKVAVEQSRIKFGDETLIILQCGHMLPLKQMSAKGYELVSSDSRRLMQYQEDTVKFAEQANCRILIAHEQGLGKTVIVEALFKLHPELFPAVVVVPTSVKAQWFWETIRWVGHPKDGGPMTQVIQSSKEKAMPGFQLYIVSYDMLKTDGMFSFVKPKTVVLDECQRIKNHLSDRAKACQRLCKNAEHIIGLSGTPIKNHAGEYFTILNILQPARFPFYQGYIDTYCDAYWNGYGNKVGGLKNPEMFKAQTEDFITRKTKAEVLPDLPELSRKFYHVELDPRLNKAYAEALKELDDLLYDDEVDEQQRGTQTIAIMSKMRKITGISKCAECTDFVTEHLLNTDRKIVIFVHHHDVHTLLEKQLSDWCKDGGFLPPLSLTSSLDGNGRAAIVEKFKTSEHRILIASTLAAGEGLNLQFCSDAVMLERQWNPPNEEQAESRFHRFGQKNPVSVTYMLAAGTIDEYFTELVEQKRAIITSTVDGKVIEWNQQSLMQELAQILVTTGREKWHL